MCRLPLYSCGLSRNDLWVVLWYLALGHYCWIVWVLWVAEWDIPTLNPTDGNLGSLEAGLVALDIFPAWGI